MLKNYLKIALRTIQRQKGYAFINVVGLAAGLACCLLILFYVQDELRYDRFHTDADRIYRVVEVIEGSEESASAPFPTGPTLREDFPHLVASSVRFFNLQAPTLALTHEPEDGQAATFNERRFFFVDSTIFEVFDFNLVRGSEATALDRPGAVVITQEAALRYFGDEDPIGKVLRLEGQHALEVTGVLAEVPAQSHFTFDFLASFSTLRGAIYQNEPEQLQDWYWNPVWTYVLLQDGVAPDDLEAQFPGFIAQYWPEQIKPQSSLYLQPLTDIHLHSRLDYEIAPNSDASYVYIFSVIALFVLLTACINFMNLATAQSMTRAREVGIRKAIGAQRRQLVVQFLSESLLLSLVALVLALPLVGLLLPVLNDMAGKALSLDPLGMPWLVPVVLFVVLGVGVLAGLYPAFFLARYQPSRVLKGSLRTDTGGAATLRKGLVIVQFAISIVLITGTFIVVKQLDYLRSVRLGFETEQVMMIPILRTGVGERYDAIKEALLQQPGVRAVTVAEDALGSRYQTSTYEPEGYTESVQFPRLLVHDDFLETFGIPMAAGQSYEEGLNHPPGSVIINEAMVRHLGWASPEEAVGQRFGQFLTQEYTVVGVSKDFHFASLHKEVGPFVLQYLWNPDWLPDFGRYLVIRMAPGDLTGTLAAIEETWHAFVPDRPFEYLFVDQELDQLYRAEENLSRVAGAFSILAILIACLGLFALAAFAAEQRTKEIGVRKVLGASVGSIIALLSRDFVVLVVVAFVVAAPVTYFASRVWLGDFAYRVEVGVGVFLLAGVLALAIALLTISYQSVKAALADPVKSLRQD